MSGIITPKIRDWGDLIYLTEYTKGLIRREFEVRFGAIGETKKKQKGMTEKEESSSDSGDQKLIFIVGPESMGVLEIVEVVKEKANAGFYNAQLLEDSLIHPSALEHAIQHARAQKEQNVIILLDDLAAAPQSLGMPGSFENWDNIIRSVTHTSKKAAPNTTIVWHCTSPELSQISSESQRSLIRDAGLVFVELPSSVEVRERWLKHVVQGEDIRNLDMIEVEKLAPKCLDLGYFDIKRALKKAQDEATSKNSCVTTQAFLKAIGELQKIDYDKAFVEGFVQLGYPPPPPPLPTHKWDELVGLDLAKITFHYLKCKIDEGKGADYNTMLLWGTPGCGKTFFAKIAADISGYKLIKRTGTQLIGAYIGHTERAIHSFFNYIEKTAKKMPVFAFVDEADPFFVSRDAKLWESDPYRKAAVEALISRLGGFNELKNVIFVMSVNYPDSIDDAVARRFSYRLFIGPPNEEGYIHLWKRGLSKAAKRGINVKMSDEDYKQLARMTYNKVLPSHIDGAQSVIENITGSCKEKIDLEYITSVMEGKNFYTDATTIERFKKRKTELPDNHPFAGDDEHLKKYIASYGEELAITTTWKEIVKPQDDTLYPLFSDVVGMGYEKLNLILICKNMLDGIEQFRRAERGTINPVVVALWGPYGTGKTHLVKAVCNQTNLLFKNRRLPFTFHMLNGGEEMTVEELKKELDKASSSPPSILFIDEAERMFPSFEFSTVKKDIVSTFLTMIQGAEAKLQGVMLVLSTNKPQEIDKGIWSRTSTKLYVPLPKPESIPKMWQKILEVEAPKLDTSKLNYNELAAKSLDVPPRKIQQVCIKAAAICAAMGKKEILTEDILPILENQPRESILQWDEAFIKSNTDPWIDREGAKRLLKENKEWAQLIKPEDIELVASQKSHTGNVSPSQNRKTIMAQIETVVAPDVEPSAEEMRYETLEVVKTSDDSQVSTAWLKGRLGNGKLPKIFYARLFVLKGSIPLNIEKVEFVHHDNMDKSTIRLSSNILRRLGISGGIPYQIRIEILEDEIE